jgi:hypothetical protein
MLKFHGTPVGGTAKDAIMFLSGRNALFSYYTKGHIQEVLECCDSFIIDNGAFSHWKSGKGEINLSEYFDWQLPLSKHPAHYFTIIPDVIDGTEEQNDKLLLEWEKRKCKKSSPVFHLGESVNRFKTLSDNYEVVCIGSTSSWARNGSKEWWENMSEFMDSVVDTQGNFPCKVHGLRLLDPRIFTKLPLHSADSTNATVNGHRCQKEGILKSMTRWQGNIRIAQRIEHFQSANNWHKDNLKLDLHGYIDEEDKYE